MTTQMSCGQCGQRLTLLPKHLGRNIKCPSCNHMMIAPQPSATTSNDNGPPAESHHSSDNRRLALAVESLVSMLQSQAVTGNQSNGNSPVFATKRYKVLTQKDKWFSGKFDPEQLENALNAYAEQGWSVKGVTTASIPSFGGHRDELVVVLER